MTNTNQTDILAPEILAHTTAPRALQVGDLAVFTDYKGRQVGCRIVRAWAAGDLAGEAQVEIQFCGLSVPAPYTIGARMTADARKVARAI